MTFYSRRSAPPLPLPESLPFPGNVIRLCTDCGVRKGCSAPVPGHGLAPAEVMFVGQNPGKSEDLWGKPFIGQAGRYLESLLFQCGVNRESVFISNLVKCLTAGNRTPTTAEIQACSKWLDIEISLVNPRIIVAMGALAIARFLGQGAGTVEHLHGKPVEINGRIILPCYHPAAALHDTAKLRQCAEDFQVLRGLITGKTPADYQTRDEYPNTVHTVADTPHKLKLMLDEVRDVGECAIDTETVKRNTELWSAQVSAIPGTAWFIPINGKQKRLDVCDWGATIIVHHYLNDIKWLDIPDDNFCDTMVMSYLTGQPQGLKELASRLCGIPMKSYSEMVRPGQRAISLDYLTSAAKRSWSDPPEITETKWDNKEGKVVTKIKSPWHISRKIKKLLADMVDNLEVDPMDRWNSIPEPERAEVEKALGRMPESSLADIKFEDAVDYACRDAMATLRVKHKLDKMIDDLGLNFVLHIDLGILPMVDEMMRNGMAVDIAHFRKLSAEYTVRMANKAEEMSKLIGHSFNPNSSNQVAQVVYGELGFKPTAYTPTHEISTDDQELKKVAHPVAKMIINYRGLAKLKGTYADNMVEMSVPDETGQPRIHTTLKTTRVETGRLSSAEPNLQNIPTRNKEGKVIREGFVAPPGKLLAELDYSQIEMVTLAHLSRCKRLIELFLRGGDPHTEMAATIFDKSLEEAKQDRFRYPVKRLNFGIAYLIGARGLSDQIQEYIADLAMEGTPVEIEPWDEPTCEKFIAEWYKLNPEVKDFQLEMAAMARRYGYVRDIFGRMRYIPEVTCPITSIQEAGLRQAANMPVTSSAQEIIKTAMCDIWRELPKTAWKKRAKIVMQIHDSLIAQVDESEEIWRPYLSWMSKVMTTGVKLLVPVKVDLKMGKSWAKMEKVKL